MNLVLKSIIEKSYPKFNPVVVRGAADQILDNLPTYYAEYVDKTMAMIDGKVDLKFVGVKRVSAEEAFEQDLKANSSNSSTNFKFDITESYTNMFQYHFKYQGSDIYTYMLLPYAEKGNLIKFTGNWYHIVPVLTDTVVTPAHNSVFVRVMQDKLNFKTFTRNILVDGTEEIVNIVHAPIIKLDSKQVRKEHSKLITPTILYHLAKFGVWETLSKYAQLGRDQIIFTMDTVNDELYRDYKLIQSTGKKPSGMPNNVKYVGHNFKILLRRDVKVTDYIVNFVGALIYIFDVIPDVAEFMCKEINKEGLEGEISGWKMLLGNLGLKFSYSDERMMREVNNIMELIDFYLDNISQKRLENINIPLDNFYDLLYIVISRYGTWSLNYKEYTSRLENRYIDISYYLLYDAFISFNRIIRKLIKRTQKNTIIAEKNISRIFGSEIKKRLIFNGVQPWQMSLCFCKTDYPGDNMFPKGTKHLEDQNRGNGHKRAKHAKYPMFMKYLKAEDMILGNLLLLAKKNPTPRLSCNPWLDYDVDTGKINLTPEHYYFIESMNKHLSLFNGALGFDYENGEYEPEEEDEDEEELDEE